MLNHINVMGRMVRDPELRRTGSGIAVASFTIACDRDFSGRDGGEKEVDFIDCVAWRNTGEFVSKYFTKGRMAVVSGRLQIRNWTDKEGNKRRNAEIVADNVYFGDSKQEGNNHGGYNNAPAPGGYNPPPTSYGAQGNTGGCQHQSYNDYDPPAYPSPDGPSYGEYPDYEDGELPF